MEVCMSTGFGFNSHVNSSMFMEFNANFNNISWQSAYWWRKLEYQEKTTDLSKVTDIVSTLVVNTKNGHQKHTEHIYE
jgi:hypothetical protein